MAGDLNDAEEASLAEHPNYWREVADRRLKLYEGAVRQIETLTTEGAIMREALRKIAEEHDADGSMRFEAQAALDSVSGRLDG